MPIEYRQIYRSCRPGRSTRVRVVGFIADLVWIVDENTGAGNRVISRVNFHDSPITRSGKLRRSGYVLETK